LPSVAGRGLLDAAKDLLFEASSVISEDLATLSEGDKVAFDYKPLSGT
jgi:hypothetical protein